MTLSRINNKLLTGIQEPKPRRKEEEKSPQKRKVLYDRTNGEGVLFEGWDAIEEALESGNYVKRPGDIAKHAENTHSKKHMEPAIEAMEEVNYAEKLKFRDSNKPALKRSTEDMQKYLSQMNVKNLIKEGKKWGLDFSDYYDKPRGKRPTKMDMRMAIKVARNKKAGKRFT